jgi:hypothetical protein
MTTRLHNTPTSLVLQSTHPAHANQLSLVSPEVRDLFEAALPQYQVFELRVDGFDIANSTAGWEGDVPFEQVHYLRLIVEFQASFGRRHDNIVTNTP